MSKTAVKKSQQTNEFPNSEKKKKDDTTKLFDSYRVGGPYWKKTLPEVLSTAQPGLRIKVPRRTAAYATLRPRFVLLMTVFSLIIFCSFQYLLKLLEHFLT